MEWTLVLIGIVVSFVGVALQLIIAPNFEAKCPNLLILIIYLLIFNLTLKLQKRKDNF